MRKDIDINLIASMLTDDPDLFIEAADQGVKCKCGLAFGNQAQCVSCGTMKNDVTNPKRGYSLKDGKYVRAENIKPKASKKKKKRTEPDTEKFDDKFEAHDGHDEKKEPAKPGEQKRSSSLKDGPTGEEGSKSSPYLKSSK